MTDNQDAGVEADLAPRKQPTQARAKERVERILNATADLLEEVGVDSLTTNLIADRASVQVASLYQYFPNKYAVLAALAEQMFAEQNRRVEALINSAEFADSWADGFDRVFDEIMAGRLAQPGGVALRTSLAAVPELAAVRERDREYLSERIAVALQAAGARVSAHQLRTIAQVVYDAGVAVMDHAIRTNTQGAEELLGELKLLQRSYLANYLGEPGA